MEQVAANLRWPAKAWARIAVVTGIFALTALWLDLSVAISRTFAPASVVTARVVGGVLTSFGMEVRREGAILIHANGFGYEIVLPCTGLIPAGLLAIAVLVSAGPMRRRLLGASLGVVSFLGFNVIRLLSLFYTLAFYPQVFDLMHSFIWQGLTVAFLLAFFWWWKRWSMLSEQQNGTVIASYVQSAKF